MSTVMTQEGYSQRNGLGTTLPERSDDRLSRWDRGQVFESIMHRSQELPDSIQTRLIDYLSSRKIPLQGIGLAVFTEQIAEQLNQTICMTLLQSDLTKKTHDAVETSFAHKLAEQASRLAIDPSQILRSSRERWARNMAETSENPDFRLLIVSDAVGKNLLELSEAVLNGSNHFLTIIS